MTYAPKRYSLREHSCDGREAHTRDRSPVRTAVAAECGCCEVGVKLSRDGPSAPLCRILTLRGRTSQPAAITGFGGFTARGPDAMMLSRVDGRMGASREPHTVGGASPHVELSSSHFTIDASLGRLRFSPSRARESRQNASPKLLINPWSCFLTLNRGRLSNCSFNRIVHTTW